MLVGVRLDNGAVTAAAVPQSEQFLRRKTELRENREKY